MSWLFSQALVEEYLGDTCSAGEQSVQLSGNPTQLAYCAPDKMTEFSRLSRYGMTYKPLTESSGEELLMSYLAAFPAKTSQQQEKAQGLTESEAGCGSTWRGWLAKFDPATSSWRTAQCSFIEDLPESLETFPRSGMTRDGLLWELPMSERRTNATGSGLWPTPTTQDNVQIRGVGAAANSPNRGTTLGGAVRMWPTPNADDHKAGMSNAPARQQSSLPRSVGVSLGVTQKECGGLNPTWVEWLMGWPLGWTDLKPLETDKFQKWLDAHGSC
jgi:hypothetical protein